MFKHFIKHQKIDTPELFIAILIYRSTLILSRTTAHQDSKSIVYLSPWQQYFSCSKSKIFIPLTPKFDQQDNGIYRYASSSSKSELKVRNKGHQHHDFWVPVPHAFWYALLKQYIHFRKTRRLANTYWENRMRQRKWSRKFLCDVGNICVYSIRIC